MNNISENVYMNVADEIIWLSVSKYALFMSHGKVGIDAMALYIHYQFSARIQKTNSVWATDKYCRQGLNWGRDRFEKAKALLIDLDLITVKQTKAKDGKFSKSYVVVKTRTVELEPTDIDRVSVFPQADSPASGQTATNALTNNRNALTNNRNALTRQVYEQYFNHWNSKNIIVHDIEVADTHIKKKHIDLIKLYIKTNGEDCINKAIDNYSDIINSDKYYFSHKWTFWDFLIRGLSKFIDNANPKDNFRSGRKKESYTESSYSEREEAYRKAASMMQ